MKNNKTKGYDIFQAELLKLNSEQSVIIMALLLEHAGVNEVNPVEWTKSLIIKINIPFVFYI